MEIVGVISKEAIALLELGKISDNKIYIGQSNIAHMKKSHPSDYEKYGRFVREILSAPDYLGRNPKDGSIEYVKEFMQDNEYVKVAVRISGKGKFFARSLYILNRHRVENFIACGTLKKFGPT